MALPKGAYAQALHYNRKLFAQAGPRPEQAADDLGTGPADASQITQKTGKAGYVADGARTTTPPAGS